MSHKTSIAMVVVFGVLVCGAVSAEAGGRGQSGGGSHRSSQMVKIKSNQSLAMNRMTKNTAKHGGKNSPPKFNMGGSSTGPVGTPENPNKTIVRDHRGSTLADPVVRDHRGSTFNMGGSSTGPVGTPENPNKTIVRDHRGSTLADPVVRDHRGSTLPGLVVRDHR